MQDHYFKLDTFDYDLVGLYCAILQFNNVTRPEHASDMLNGTVVFGEQAQEKDVEISQRRGLGSNNIPTALMCVGGGSRYTWPMWIVRELWRQVPHLPKFAYVNMMAGHNFAKDSTLLENLDGILERFLSEFLQEASGSRQTIVVLRSDHGTQNGPLVFDWSTQVEQRNPFAYLLVPKAILPPTQPQLKYNAVAASANQYKLVTSFDFYKTLCESSSSQQQACGPSWAYNLLSAAVPANRSCYDARIPFAYCMLEHEQHTHQETDDGALDFSYEPRFDLCHEDGEKDNLAGFNSCPLSWPRPMVPSYYNQTLHQKHSNSETAAAKDDARRLAAMLARREMREMKASSEASKQQSPTRIKRLLLATPAVARSGRSVCCTQNNTVAETCLDKNDRCPYWASIGECNNNPGYMLVHCEKSCEECTLAPTAAPTPAPAPSTALKWGAQLDSRLDGFVVSPVRYGLLQTSPHPPHDPRKQTKPKG